MPENKILIIRGGAIGDFILTLPVLAALRRQLPETRLEVLGYPHIAQLALAGGLADSVRAIEARGLAGFFARGGTLAPELADYFAGFALILSYLYDPDGIFQENIARVTRTQFIAGPHRPDETVAMHATEVFLKPLERLAIFDADPVPRLSLNSQRSTLNQLALHPGSGSDQKNWPEPHWAELLQLLVTRTDWNILLVGGEAEGDRLHRLAAPLPPHRVALAQHVPLAELAARLQSCAAFIGHDSGITHLATALDLPTFALWGDTVEAVWRPPGKHVVILRDPSGLRGISPARVFDEFTRRLEEPSIRDMKRR